MLPFRLDPVLPIRVSQTKTTPRRINRSNPSSTNSGTENHALDSSPVLVNSPRSVGTTAIIGPFTTSNVNGSLRLCGNLSYTHAFTAWLPGH